MYKQSCFELDCTLYSKYIKLAFSGRPWRRGLGDLKPNSSYPRHTYGVSYPSLFCLRQLESQEPLTSARVYNSLPDIQC